MISSVDSTRREHGWLTLKEAAVLAGVTEKTIRHELAGKVVTPRRKKVGKRSQPQFGPHDVLYFSLVFALPVALKKEDRRDLFVLIHGKKTEEGHWRRAPGRLTLRGTVEVEVKTGELFRQSRERLRLFRRGRRRVVSSPKVLGGEPVFEGTRIAVRHVGQLVKRGIPEAELLEDFPSLRREDLGFARFFVELGPPPGRPRKLKFIREGG